VFSSTDGGRHWGALTLPPWAYAQGVSFPTPERGYITLGSGGAAVLLRPDDGRQTWAQIWPPALVPVDNGIQGVWLTASGSGAWAASDGRLLRTGDGGDTWTPVGAPPGYVQALGSGDGRSVYAITAGAGGAFTLERSAGAGWSETAIPTGVSPRVLAVAPHGSLWLATASGHMYRSAEGGAPWTSVNTWAPADAGPVVDALAAVSAKEAWAVGGGELHRFAHGAWSTYRAPDGLAFADVSFADAADGAALAYDAATCSYTGPCAATLFLITDGGARWTERPLPHMSPAGDLAMALAPYDPPDVRPRAPTLGRRRGVVDIPGHGDTMKTGDGPRARARGSRRSPTDIGPSPSGGRRSTAFQTKPTTGSGTSKDGFAGWLGSLRRRLDA